MRKNLLYSLLSLCAVLLFWACGEGVVESAEDSDHLALERYENLTAADVIDALEQCKGNKECESQITQAFRDNPISKKDPVDEDTVVSSSSVKDSVLSSSSLSIKSSSSVTDSLSSSAPADSLSSSVNEESSSSVEESSSSAPESSSSVEESSSSAPESSSSVEESSSSEPESSSSEEESSSSEEVILPLGGTCVPVDKQAYVGDTVVWQYVKNEGTRDGKVYEWENLDGARGTGFQTTSVPMVGMVFDSPLDKTFPLLTVDGQDMGECVSVKIVARPVESSSSVTSSPSSSPTSGTSSSVRSSSSTPQYSSSDEPLCDFNGILVPCSMIPSSSSVTPSSSSVVSSSSEPPSSSSQESSSSEESSSSVGPTVVDNFVPSDSYTLSTGTYELQQCNGKTGSQRLQVEATFGNAWTVFGAGVSDPTNPSYYWYNADDGSRGETQVVFPVTVEITTGTMTIKGGCW